MKLEDITKKQPFEMPNEAHFDSISSKIYAQIEKEEQNLNTETKSVSINSEKTKNTNFWIKPQFMGIAATLLLLFVALVGISNYNSGTDSIETVALENKQAQKIDFSKIPTEQINEFLLNEDISESELVSFIPQNSTLENNSIFKESDLNSIDAESLDLMLEEEYL
ncbi:hypothetical protein Fleli_3561 [Bernardetia litoralis DSM 6794]|uniref:Uncharacterized protein n=1 Tax=Bernardetia litoralis (strain ATCC 23117 / DSM 6794 / NBRC 15988 / NCIMB 1366 / Fx l1 / Sio-4) TaxID=880071 RepID=I4APJ5_BERLS|nr:hypothetical protein [Bernardetia litoralis]AFM05880.1 hypothetical protein Fleli_3561 [Bernardetia litoralis DSM 6794]